MEITRGKAIWKAFQEQYNDNELYDRYLKFIENAKSINKKHNELVPIVNDKIAELGKIEKCIFQLALLKSFNDELLSSREKLIQEIDELKDTLKHLNDLAKKEENLIDSYKNLSDERFFTWYKALKAAKCDGVTSWLEFKNKWVNKII